jgi:hypothetical protein
METGFPDRRAFLSWDEVSEMSHHGITFGSHTCTHPILTNTPMRVVDQELQGSLETLPTSAIPTAATTRPSRLVSKRPDTRPQSPWIPAPRPHNPLISSRFAGWESTRTSPARRPSSVYTSPVS